MYLRVFKICVTAACLVAPVASVSAQSVVPRGLYINGGQNGVAQEALDHPDVAGMLIQSQWSNIEAVQGQFDWTTVDDRVQQAADSGKLVRIALHAGGDGVPGWVTNLLDVNGGPIVSIAATKNGQTIDIPAFWDDAFLVHKTNFYHQIALRYGSHPSVAALSVSIADPFTGDWGFYGVDAQSAADAGYDSVVFAGKWRDLVREMMTAAPQKMITTAVGSTPRAILDIVNPGEDRYFAFNTAMTLMASDPDIQMSRLAGGKGALTANTPDPADPNLQLPGDLREWQTMYNLIVVYGANGFAQTSWNVTFDPDFKMNAGVPYGGPGEPTAGDILLESANIAKSYGLLWFELWEVDVLNTATDVQAAIAQAADLFGCPADTNGDGMLTSTDFSAWIAAFNNNLAACDQNGDGSCTPTDFTAWIANFNAGC